MSGIKVMKNGAWTDQGKDDTTLALASKSNVDHTHGYDELTGTASKIKYQNLTALPAGPNILGETCMVLGKLYRCTTAGSPGVWTDAGQEGWPAMPPGLYTSVIDIYDGTSADKSRVFYVPFDVTDTVTIDGMGVLTGLTDGDPLSRVSLGFYADNGANRPGELLLDFGDIPTPTKRTFLLATAMPITVPPARYWTAVVANSPGETSPFRSIKTTGGYRLDNGSSPSRNNGEVGHSRYENWVTGDLPATANTPSSGALAGVPVTWIRITA